MNPYTPKVALLLCGFFLLSLCSFSVFLFSLMAISALCAIYGQPLSATNLAGIYAILPAPYFLVLFLSFLLDLARSYLSNFQALWLRILVLEGLASAMLLYSYIRLSTARSVCTIIYYSYMSGIFEGHE